MVQQMGSVKQRALHYQGYASKHLGQENCSVNESG